MGSIVWVADPEVAFRAVGNLTDRIARTVGWTHQNVWMPDHVYSDLADARGLPFVNPIEVAAAMLDGPISVHRDKRQANALYLIASGQTLRERSVLLSRSVLYVDAVIELRQINDMVLPRLFHLSPRKRNHGGVQLWP